MNTAARHVIIAMVISLAITVFLGKALGLLPENVLADINLFLTSTAVVAFTLGFVGGSIANAQQDFTAACPLPLVRGT